MGYVEAVFLRTDLRKICSFISNGAEDINFENQSYDERIKIANDIIYNQLKLLCLNNNDYERASEELSKALSIYEKVYTEIGMIAGARILSQLLNQR